MSAPIERKVPPNPFRDQYAGGVKPDAEFEAALNGADQAPVQVRPAPQPVPGAGSAFGPMVKLR